MFVVFRGREIKREVWRRTHTVSRILIRGGQQDEDTLLFLADTVSGSIACGLAGGWCRSLTCVLLATSARLG